MDITARLRSKRFAHATTNGHILRITMEDNSELDVMWVDGNGVPIKGKPVVVNHGVRLNARGINDLINAPELRGSR